VSLNNGNFHYGFFNHAIVNYEPSDHRVFNHVYYDDYHDEYYDDYHDEYYYYYYNLVLDYVLSCYTVLDDVNHTTVKDYEATTTNTWCSEWGNQGLLQRTWTKTPTATTTTKCRKDSEDNATN